MSEIVELSEAAQLLKCTEQTVMEELRDGRLPGVKFGREWIIPRVAFFARLNEMAAQEAADRRAQKIPVGAVALPTPRVRRHPLVEGFGALRGNER